MRFRPGTPVRRPGCRARGCSSSTPAPESPPGCYGTTDPVDVPTLHAELSVTGWWSARAGQPGAHPPGRGEAALAAFGDELGARGPDQPPRCGAPGTATSRRSPRPTSQENLGAFDEHDLPVDVVQIDDGWSPGLGEGLGRRGAIRLPARVVDRDPWHAAVAPGCGWRRSSSGRDHAGPRASGLAGPTGRPQLGPGPRAGSTSPTQACASCSPRTCGRLVGLGIDYLKLDFLYAGASPVRRRGVEVAAYRAGLDAGPGGGRAGRATSSAAARRCCPASAWSTRCGSRPTPSTRAARTGPPGCAG